MPGREFKDIVLTVHIDQLQNARSIIDGLAGNEIDIVGLEVRDTPDPSAVRHLMYTIKELYGLDLERYEDPGKTD
jgi:hypothetical protein